MTDKPILDCCACGTAKYRLTFYGNWSEKTHPKDFPREYHSSTIVVPYRDCEDVGACCMTQQYLFTAQQCKLWHIWNTANVQYWKSMDLSVNAIHYKNSIDLPDSLLWGVYEITFSRFLCGEKGYFFKLRPAYNVKLGNEILRKMPQRMGNTLMFWFTTMPI